MMVYLKNMAGFKMDFFKGMSYDVIRPIFEKHFNSIVAFLEKVEKELEEEASKATKRKSKTSNEKAAKKQKLNEEGWYKSLTLSAETILIGLGHPSSLMNLMISFSEAGGVKEHGFDTNYTCWNLHGEIPSQVDNDTIVSDFNMDENFGNDDNQRDNLDEMLHDAESNVDEKNVKKLQQLFDDVEKPLFEGCPKQPGNDIDVYLRPLIDDMIDLWETGVEIYDAYKKERHCLDVMHIEKNVCESLLGLLLNIPGKTKDGVNARKDMLAMGIRNLKLLGMKSQDCHVLLTQMISIAIYGLKPPQVRQTITKLCLFFNMIHSKVLDHEKLEELQRDIILIICQLEMYFPPSFFDVMVHLVSHIVKEIKIAGPIFLRYMYPLE
nr:hypothetical protein [Tanacetum cinerariifolium]